MDEAHPPSSAGETVEQDLLCPACSYNLRGLRVGGRCPECGAPIAAELLSSPYAEADPRWLRRVLRGVLLLQFQLAPVFLVMLLSGLVLTATRGRYLDSLLAWITWLTVVFAAPLLTGLGAAFATAAPPGPRRDPMMDRVRRRAGRANLALAVVLTAVSLALPGNFGYLVDRHRAAFVSVALPVAAGAVFAYALIAQFTYVGRLARLWNAPAVARNAERLVVFAWTAATFVLLAALLPWAQAVTPYLFRRIHHAQPGDTPLTAALLQIAGVSGVLAILVALLWSIVIYGSLRLVIVDRLEQRRAALDGSR